MPLSFAFRLSPNLLVSFCFSSYLSTLLPLSPAPSIFPSLFFCFALSRYPPLYPVMPPCLILSLYLYLPLSVSLRHSFDLSHSIPLFPPHFLPSHSFSISLFSVLSIPLSIHIPPSPPPPCSPRLFRFLSLAVSLPVFPFFSVYLPVFFCLSAPGRKCLLDINAGASGAFLTEDASLFFPLLAPPPLFALSLPK